MLDEKVHHLVVRVREFEDAGIGQAGLDAPLLLVHITLPTPPGQRLLDAHTPGQLPVVEPLAHGRDGGVALVEKHHLLLGLFKALVNLTRLRGDKDRDTSHAEDGQRDHRAAWQVARQQHRQHRHHQHQRQPAAARLRHQATQHAQRRARHQHHPHRPPDLRRPDCQEDQANQAEQQAQVTVLDRVGVTLGAREVLDAHLVDGDQPGTDAAYRKAGP